MSGGPGFLVTSLVIGNQDGCYAEKLRLLKVILSFPVRMKDDGVEEGVYMIRTCPPYRGLISTE